ncbi:MAG: carboxypeptidase regulatory-like domain-containing protein [Prolixibacteraceae bacterium]|nr:carboxypeptidase regulatory-like domain-containing protein [Prolixibacteraceae bacterium]
MNTFMLLVLLQLNLFGTSGEPVIKSKISLDAVSAKETVAFIQIGKSGNFLFSNLDAGQYDLYIEIPGNATKTLDKRMRQKFENDVEAAYNTDKETWLWQHPDGFLKVAFGTMKKLAEPYTPVFEPPLGMNDEVEETESDPNDVVGAILRKKAEAERMMNQQEDQRVRIMRFTVIGEQGSIGGKILSTTQKDFHMLTVGKADITLENKGVVEILQRFDD